MEKIKKITKGFSGEEKWLVHYEQKQCLYRQFDPQQYTQKKQEFSLLQQLFSTGTQTYEPLEIGPNYMITSFLEGLDAEDTIGTLTATEQYQVGVDASADLRRIHAIKAKENTWASYQKAKYERYRKTYHERGYTYDFMPAVEQFINAHLHLLNGRPTHLQHDDFHLPNLIIHNRHYAGVIDFGRFDWGDPVWDFVKLGLFSREHSIPFCIGLLEGYYDHHLPDDFWTLYTLYAGMLAFSSIIWADNIGQLQTTLPHVEQMIQDPHGFQHIIPSWFKSIKF
ncbi:phosphotransferase family protein [Candidatus Kurthia intestinigallinarum]|uniref:phosphotransferase family protein n=1 Tax=Candidatus Kurthia intestinigallinarum TaxID=1562256 RepID=UPI000F8CAF54|nr:phosphotransferase [Kurthia sp. 3B1D]